MFFNLGHTACPTWEMEMCEGFSNNPGKQDRAAKLHIKFYVPEEIQLVTQRQTKGEMSFSKSSNVKSLSMLPKSTVLHYLCINISVHTYSMFLKCIS